MIERTIYDRKIEPFIGKPVIKILSGMRRSGKSTYMKLLISRLLREGVDRQNIIYINKELLDFDDIKDYSDLHAYVKGRLPGNSERKYLFIDEVQEIREWERAVNSMLAEDTVDIFLTGSNSRIFSSELASLLTGRYVVIPMFTLGFREFLAFRSRDLKQDREKEFGLYLKYGGLPGIHHLTFDDEVVFQYIDSVHSTILLKDVVSRFHIRDVPLLERLIRFVFDNCGNITSAKNISDFLRSQKLMTGVQTVQNYIMHLQDAFLIHKADRYDIKGKKHLELLEKYYAGDLGIRHSVLAYRTDDISNLLENIVYLELLRRGYRVHVGKFDNLEIDFIAQRNNERLYIQVTYLLASKEIEDREFRSLEMVNDNYPKIVLSMDKVWGKERRGILRKNIIDFLLEG